MYQPDDYEIEGAGFKNGINPFFGEWHQKFELKPVSYQNTNGELKRQFKADFHKRLTNSYVFIEFVQVEIILYLNEWIFLETPSYGDLDNYAKLILDALKGKEGMLIDDCQVQRLDISWIDTPHAEHFEVRIKSRPDEFKQKSLKLYEMPNKLFYPVSKRVWTKEGIQESPQEHISWVLERLEEMTLRVKSVRHEFRQKGMTQLESFWNSNVLSPSLLGFHKNRAIESGFECVSLNDWKNKGHL